VPLARVTTSLKRDQVVDVLRQAILDGDFRPGDRIRELAVAKELGVSQTPVREALAALSKEGLVVKLDHIGTFVSSLDQVELRELLTLRAVLEGYCARLAAELLTSSEIPRLETLLEQMRAAARVDDMQSLIEADLAFHEVLYDVGGHRLLREVLSGLQQRMRLALAVADSVYSADLRDVAESHRVVIDALASGDPTVAERAAQEHVLAVLALISADGSSAA
jgi:DNA-binding GntR family transcriptional regulator